MPFSVRGSPHWHKEVPGARWFRADLHLHTLDDHPNSRLKRPAGLSGNASDPEVQRQYARAFLRAAVTRKIEVLGLTPHCVRSGENDDSSATWRIVETWNTENDEDGVPFREKIYAVFPGFEPSLSDGSRGVHLLFLFDPGIGRDRLLRAFHAVMGGKAAWSGNQLRNSPLTAEEVFDALDSLHRDEGDDWDYMCLAPHAFSKEKGLFDLRGEIMHDFPSERLSGLELGDNALPQDHAHRAWLTTNMKRLGHAFFHGSDAYEINPTGEASNLFEVGSRFSLLKLASPTIEAVRQAFLASDSRLRLAYTRAGDSTSLVIAESLPDPHAPERPWLRSIRVAGGASFFGGREGESERATEFRLSPDLTCVIGSRMSGKSTFLDGLRKYFGCPLPQDDRVQKDVDHRGSHFLRGSNVSVDVRGRTDPTGELRDRWPARFFTQRELQAAAGDQEGLKHILFHLLPGKAETLGGQDQSLRELDTQLTGAVVQLKRERARVDDKEQEFERVSGARAALERFRSVGAERLGRLQKDQGLLQTALNDVRVIDMEGAALTEKVQALQWPELDNEDLRGLMASDDTDASPANLISSLQDAVRDTKSATKKLEAVLSAANVAAIEVITAVRSEIERSIIDAGGAADELYQFERLSTVAGTYEVCLADVERARKREADVNQTIASLSDKREQVTSAHRTAMRDVLVMIESKFQSKIRLRINEESDLSSVNEWIKSLREQGISRWWKDVNSDDAGRSRVGRKQILHALLTGNTASIGMSARVGQTFKETVTKERVAELVSARSPDEYVLELRVGPGPNDYREMSRLSGGQQVSLLLSLLLETDDVSPLLIDQPEDELDSSYLFEVVLPALRRLKGKRQIVFATHNPNIVVNGDADQVVYLAGTADQGSVVVQGAIEEPEVKAAILTTVDGGQDAFRLRYAKYGF
jgi:hypothetical protein